MGDTEDTDLNTTLRANVSSYTGFNTFKNDFILEGDTTRQLYDDPIQDNVLLIGDLSGDETTIVAKTFRWGTNTVHPDNTPTVGGRMELPLKWGRNGSILGINGGIIDWVDFSTDICFNNIFGFSNYGTRSVQNKMFPALKRDEYYDNYRLDSAAEQTEKLVVNYALTQEIKVSSTLGMFCDASGFSSTTIGWQNNTNQAFSNLIGTNLDLSMDNIYDANNIGEVIVGHANKRCNQREMLNQPRAFTVGNGDISNSAAATRSDAFFILKDGNSYFNKNVTISGGGLSVEGEINLYNNLILKDGGYIITNDISTIGITTTSLKGKNIKTNEITSVQDNDNNFADTTGLIDVITQNGLRIKKFKINNGLNYVTHNKTNNLTHDELAKNSIIFDNTAGLQIFSTNATNRPVGSLGGNTNYNSYNTEQIQREAYGSIQILHPDAYDSSNVTGMDGSGIYPPNVKIPYRGNILTWYGISCEEITSDTLHVKGVNLLPKTYDIFDDTHPDYYRGRNNLVLDSNGNGTVEWRPVDLGNAVNLTLPQLADTYEHEPYSNGEKFLYLGKTSATSNLIHTGYNFNMLKIDLSLNVGSYLTVGNNAHIDGNTTITGHTTINNGISITNDSNINGKLDISGNLDISKNINTQGSAYIKETLDVSGDVNVDGNTKILGTVTVDNNAFINGNLDISGNLDLSHNVTAVGDLDISGSSHLKSTVLTDSNIICGNNIYFKNINNVTEPPLQYNNVQYSSLLRLITQQVSYAISNSITNPPGTLIWSATETAPVNYGICNGRHYNKIQYEELYNVLPSYISTIQDDASHNFILNITDNISIDNLNTTVFFSVKDMVSKKIMNSNEVKSNAINLINNDSIRIDISNASQNIDYFNFKIKGLPSETIYETALSWSDLSNTYIVDGNTTHAYGLINTGHLNSTDVSFELDVIIKDTNDVSHNIYKTSDYNKTTKFDRYVGVNQNDFKQKYFKVPNLIGRFAKGSEVNIGHFYEDSIKDHHHETVDHTHIIDVSGHFPHNHNSTSTFTGDQINNHRHNIPMSHIDGTNSTVKSSNNDVSFVIVPTTNNVGQDTLSQNTDLKGASAITGNVNTTLDICNLEISFNTVTNGAQADVTGIVDVNKQPIQNKSETAPKHMLLLPCISLGKNTGEEIVINTGLYSNERRLDFIENRLSNMDVCMNTHLLNVHSFTNNPSGLGI